MRLLAGSPARCTGRRLNVECFRGWHLSDGACDQCGGLGGVRVVAAGCHAHYAPTTACRAVSMHPHFDVFDVACGCVI